MEFNLSELIITSFTSIEINLIINYWSYGIKNYCINVPLNDITSVPHFVKIYQAVQKLLVGDRQTDRPTDWLTDWETWLFYKYTFICGKSLWTVIWLETLRFRIFLCTYSISVLWCTSWSLPQRLLTNRKSWSLNVNIICAMYLDWLVEIHINKISKVKATLWSTQTFLTCCSSRHYTVGDVSWLLRLQPLLKGTVAFDQWL
jgi:hypothetical protein